MTGQESEIVTGRNKLAYIEIGSLVVAATGVFIGLDVLTYGGLITFAGSVLLSAVTRDKSGTGSSI